MLGGMGKQMSEEPGERGHILIVGAGFAGVGLGVRLRQAGVENFTILEQASGLGGTWRDNHYPGAACDVPSHLYSFSFAPNPGWSRMFAPQREILEYLERCVDKFDLRRHIRFGCGVTRAVFDEGAGVWEVEGSDGARLRARVLVAGCGGLSRPSWPAIAGLDRFAGPTFHSARWDHEYPLEGKRVAVIGTGASAIQVVPAIAPRVGRLHLFQRTPPWVMPRPDRAISPAEQALFRAAPALQQLARGAIYLQFESRALGFVVDPRLMRLGERQARAFLVKSVADPTLRARLTPSYTMGCKRVLLSNDYYPAVQRSSVELVTDAIAEINPRGVVTVDGQERPVDALVLCTGFQAAEAAAPFAVTGAGGRDLDAAWRDGAEAYLGTTVAGFPNLFLLVGPNTGLGHSSMVYMIESQLAYVLDAIRMMRARGLRQVSVRPDAQARYNQRLHARLARTVWASGCSSWYRTRSGKNTTLWPGFTFEFRRRTRRFDEESYELIAEGAASPRPRAAPAAPSPAGG
jgi:cation diffusion facilitator CzcD-associated flavoprotein CzcO